MALDPVCGMTVDPATARGGSFEHAGTTYYFCSAGCRTKFSTDPDGWLKSGPKGMAASPMTLRRDQEGRAKRDGLLNHDGRRVHDGQVHHDPTVHRDPIVHREGSRPAGATRPSGAASKDTFTCP